MINREMKPVTVNTYTSGVDSYGQKRKTISSQRTVDMVCKLYAQNEVKSPLYNDVELLGITKDFTITSANSITVNGTTYDVLHTIPSGKYNQILMQKVK